MSVTELVSRQYSEFPYPPPMDITTTLEQGDPSFFSAQIWPEGRAPSGISILVAGCGTQQAATFAYRNPACPVVGIDISENSLAHTAVLKERHTLNNLSLHRMDLQDAGSLGQQFDLVVSSGVLHHLEDPVSGLRALAGILEPSHGSMCLMLYAPTLRHGVYLLQDAFRRMGLRQDTAGITTVRQTLARLNDRHPVRGYTAAAGELATDAALVDTFLHPQDRAYSVPQVLDLLQSAKLQFHTWCDNAHYYSDALFPPGDPVGDRIAALSDTDQWAVMENLRCLLGTHTFLACRPERDSRAFIRVDNSLRELVPHRHPQFEIVETANAVPERVGRYKRGTRTFTLTPAEALLFGLADGKRNIGEALEHPMLVQHSHQQRQTFAFTFYPRMVRMGHLFLSSPR